MDTNLTQYHSGDSLTNNKKRKRNKGAKMKANKGDGFQIKDQIDANQAASDQIRDYTVVNTDSEKNLLDKDVAELQLSAGNMDKKKPKKRKGTKKKVNTMDEVQSINQVEMNKGTIEICAGVEDQMDEKLKASDSVSDFDGCCKLDHGSTVNASKGNMDKKKLKRRKKTKKKLINEVQTMDQMEMNTETTEHLPEIKDELDDKSKAFPDCDVGSNESENNLLVKDVAGLHLVEDPMLTVRSTEHASEGNSDTKTVKRRKKTKNKLMNEVKSMDHQMEMNAGATEHLPEIKDEMKDKSKASRKVIDQEEVNNELEKNLLVKDATVLPLVEDPMLAVGSTEHAPEGNSDAKTVKRRKKIKKKVIVLNELPSMDLTKMNMGTTENLAEIKYQMDDNLETSDQLGDCSAINKESEKNILDIDLTVPPLVEHPKLDVGSTEDASVVDMDKKKIKRRKKIKKKVDVLNEVQSMAETEMNSGTTEDLAEIKDQMDDDLVASQKIGDSNVVNTESEKSLLGKDVTVLPLPEHPMLESGSTGSASEGKMNKENKKKRKKVNKKVNVANEVQSMEQMEQNRTSTNLAEVKDQVGVTENASEENMEKINVMNEGQTMDQMVMITGTTENSAESIANGKRKRKKNIKTAKNKDEVQSMNEANGKDVSVLPLAEYPELNAGSTEKASEENTEKINVMNEVQTMDQRLMISGTTENLAESIVNGKRKRKKKNKKKAKNKDGVQIMNEANVMLKILVLDENQVAVIDKLSQNNFGSQESEESLRKGPGTFHRDHDMNNMSAASSSSVHDKENPLYLSNHEETVLLSDVIGFVCNKASDSVEERSGDFATPMDLDRKSSPCGKLHSDQAAQDNEKLANGLIAVKDEIIVYQGKCAAEGRSVSPTCNSSEATTHLSTSYLKEGNYVYQLPAMGLVPDPRTAMITYRRKLLVLDINGLLADIVMPAPKDRRGDIHILGRAIFKRPFCDDFLRFCFQNFDVGIWSSRSKRLIDRVVDYLLGNLRRKLLFCWDMTHATQSSFKTLENIHKPLVCKELRKCWGDDNHRFYWKKGDYDKSNTLLLDDSPYKALLNPLHTAIFPYSFSYKDENDNLLGPGGDLRGYLEGLLTSDNVQIYVEQYPFGQGAISEKHPSWNFYSKVLETLTQQRDTSSSVPILTEDLQAPLAN